MKTRRRVKEDQSIFTGIVDDGVEGLSDDRLSHSTSQVNLDKEKLTIFGLANSPAGVRANQEGHTKERGVTFTASTFLSGTGSDFT